MGSFFVRCCVFFLLSLIVLVHGVADTDEYTDADIGQSSYLPNHNIDPAVVDSNQFGLLWKQPFNNLEQFYAKPLLFTPNGGKQLIFLASSQNYIRTLDAVTGALLNARQVQTPFLQSDIGCTDIPNTIGIIGTPVIDPTTEIAYFYAKTYIPNYRTAGNTGTFNGVYYFYAVNIADLSDVDGFPILVDGSPADNDPRKYFIGGVILQRPSLLKVGSVVYAGFGGHCDLFNYTGTVLGVDVEQKKVVTNFATSAGPNSPYTGQWNVNGAGGQSGIWMSGMGLASDGYRLFFATGNGQGGENQGIPASGQSGLRTLQEVVANLGIDSGTGKLSLTDYFQPYDYRNMDGGDQDFGSGGVALLDPTVFKGTGVNRMCVTTGKNGIIYVMNADNLGGYKQGAGGSDLVLQEIVTNEAVFGGIGSYPLEGGYIYSTPVGYPTYVYKLALTQSGVPNFVLAGKTAQSSAGRVGPGVPTITTYKGQAGTAIVWMTDPDAGLRAWYAVPEPDGSMKQISIPQIGGINKFQRPAFGDGKVYTTDANGVLYCLGSPVNLPLNCTSPVDFGEVALGSKSTKRITCIALIGVTINTVETGDLHFEVDSSTIPTGTVAQGASFSFNVTWDLVNVTVGKPVNVSYGNTTPGIKSSPLTIGTTNSIGGYANSFPLSLAGTEVSEAAFLALTPQTVDFGGLITGVPNSPTTSTLTFTIQNLGQMDLHILGYAFTEDTDQNDGNTTYTNITQNSAGVWGLGNGFSTTYLPAVGSIIAAGQSVSVPATFNASENREYLSYFNLWSDGGAEQIILEGSASSAPVANITISTGEGGQLPCSITDCTINFGSAGAGDTVSRVITICNEGGSTLTITKSKPPLGVIRAQNYGIDLHESQTIPVNTCANGTLLFSPNPEPPNIPDYTVTASWALNTDDLDFGVHVVNMTGTVHDRQVGPLYPNGSSIFNYLGCYLDNGAGVRLLPQEPYVDVANNTNEECQTACLAKGYAFAGTEYHQECYCGDNLPSSQWYYPESDDRCTFSCPGDASEACGGDGGYISIYYNSEKYTVDDTTYNNTGGGTIGGPQTVNFSSPYNYIGCYSEGTGGRALSSYTPPAAPNGGSVEYCAAACAAEQYEYMGVEYSNECYCGSTINTGSVLQPGDSVSAGCNMVCGNNASEYCGGANRLNMYQLSTSSSSSSKIASISTTAPPNGTATGSVSTTSTVVTISSAAPTPLSCPASNATLYTSPAGRTYLIECGIDHAGGDINSTTAFTLAQCIGFCDAQAGCIDLSMSGVGCYMKGTLGAAVSNGGILGAKLVPALSASSSAPKSTVVSTSLSTSSSFLTPSTFGSTSSPALNATATTTLSKSLPTSSIASTSSTVSSTNSSGSTTSSVAPSQTPPTCPASNNTVYTATSGQSFLIECGIDHQGGDMGSVQVTGANAFQQCIEACASTTGCVDVSLSGVACYLKQTLGSAITAGGILGGKLLSNTNKADTSATSSSDPSAASNGDSAVSTSTSTSGSITTATSSTSPLAVTSSTSNSTRSASQSTTLVSSTPSISSSSSASASISVVPFAPKHIGNYTYQGCVNDTVSARALQSDGEYGSSTDPMTLDKCANFCSQYAYWGVEYGQECYCGTKLLNGAVDQTSGCTMTCPGNSSLLCGGGDRLNLYLYNATAAALNLTTPGT